MFQSNLNKFEKPFQGMLETKWCFWLSVHHFLKIITIDFDILIFSLA